MAGAVRGALCVRVVDSWCKLQAPAPLQCESVEPALPPPESSASSSRAACCRDPRAPPVRLRRSLPPHRTFVPPTHAPHSLPPSLLDIMPLDDTERAGIAAWIRRSWRALVAETVATALLVWLGVASMMPVKGLDSVQLTHPALAFGFIVTGNAMIFGPVSGAHMNPAITLAALVHGRIEPVLALAYVVAQMVGAVLGFGALAGVTPAHALAGHSGCTAPGPHVSAPAAAAVEAALTGLLALGCCAAWAAHDAARPDHSVPVKLGLLVAGLVYAGGFATGASLNPARSFAPALFQNYWENHWVYWVGPLAGAALAALLHRFVLSAPAPRAAAPEAVPLNDKP